MRRPVAALALTAASCAALASAAAQPSGELQPDQGRRQPLHYASPGQVVAAEVAFNLLAQRKGQWTAFRETAADTAIMFVPQPVAARKWLKGRKDPARSIAWQPHQVWMSCDGSLAATYGAWQQPGGGTGYFTTVWQRRRQGDYAWVLDQRDDLKTPLDAPEMIAASVAHCEHGRRLPPPASAAPVQDPAAIRGGTSDDRTLRWSIAVDARCGRALTVTLDRGAGKTETVLSKQVAAPPGAGGEPQASCAA